MDARFHCVVHDYSCAQWDGLPDHVRDIWSKGIFKLCASGAAAEFCERVQVGIDVYILCLKTRSILISMVFSCSSCCQSSAIMAFVYTNIGNLQHLKRSSNRLVIVAKGFLKLPYLAMLMKQKSLSLPRNLSLLTFDELLIVFSKWQIWYTSV